MDFRDFRYFEAVARFENITKAADYLKISQPPLSQQILSLENKIGVKLFYRHKKGVQLTNEGKLLLQRVRPLLKQYNELIDYVQDTQNLKVGSFTIATLPSFAGKLGSALAEIWSTTTNIHFNIIEGHAKTVKQAVENRHAQLGITRLPILNPELNYTILGNDIIKAVVNKDDSLSSKAKITPIDLKDKPMCLIKGEAPYSSYIQILQILEELNIQPKIIAETETSSTLVQLVKNGLSIGLTPESGVNLLPDNLKVLPFDDPIISVPTAIIWLKNEANTSVIKIKDLISNKLALSLV